MKRSTGGDKDWGRRQFSHIWAPMPQDFGIDNSRQCEVKFSPHSDARVDAILKIAGTLCSCAITKAKGMNESDMEKHRSFE